MFRRFTSYLRPIIISATLFTTVVIGALLSNLITEKAEKLQAVQEDRQRLELFDYLTRLTRTIADIRGLTELINNAHTHDIQRTFRQQRQEKIHQARKLLETLRTRSWPLSDLTARELDNLLKATMHTLEKEDRLSFQALTDLNTLAIGLTRPLLIQLQSPLPYTLQASASLINQWIEIAGRERGMISRVLSLGRNTPSAYETILSNQDQQRFLLQQLNTIDPLHGRTFEALFNDYPDYARIIAVFLDLTMANHLGQMISSDLGFAGFIHAFKNYVIRGKSCWYDKALHSLNATRAHNVQLKGLHLTDQYRALTRYLDNKLPDLQAKLELAHELWQLPDITIREIDRLTELNEASYAAHIYNLTRISLPVTPSRWWEIASARLDHLQQSEGTIIATLQGALTRHAERLGQERTILFVTGGTILLILFSLAHVIIRRLNYLIRLSQHLEQTRGHDTFRPFPITGHDEITSLAQTLNALMSERADYEQRIWRQAHHDALTQLPNRAYLLQILDFSLKNAHRHGHKVAVLFLDLDGFKSVNDTAGHEMGDRLLQEVAHRLQRILRESDIAARLGGDEFIVVLPHLENEDDAATVAEKIIAALSQPYVIDGQTFNHISTSLGLTLYPDDGDTLEQLMINADLAMYAAKNQGKNRWERFSPELLQEENTRNQLTEALIAAREDPCAAGFSMHYQPILDIETGCVHHFEALMRWEHPQLGRVTPDRFIPLAEEIGVIHALTAFALEEAAATAADLSAVVDMPIHITVNLSPMMAKDRFRTVFDTLSHLQQAGEPVEHIFLELTESLLMEEDEHTIEALETLRKQGHTLFLDDFGTGYSSLSYLKRYPFDVVKIDRSFIMDMLTDPQDRELVNAIITMSRTLRLKVVAEGVETAEHLQLLQQLDCDYAQGWHISPPMDRATCRTWLQQYHRSRKAS